MAWIYWPLVTGELGLLLDLEPENEPYPHSRDIVPCVGKAVIPPGSNGSNQTAWIPPGAQKVEAPKWMTERLTECWEQVMPRCAVASSFSGSHALAPAAGCRP